jgi:hypothetical protein
MIFGILYDLVVLYKDYSNNDLGVKGAPPGGYSIFKKVFKIF